MCNYSCISLYTAVHSYSMEPIKGGEKSMEYSVYVGGSVFPRFCGKYETYELAKQKADSCISTIVWIVDENGDVVN